MPRSAVPVGLLGLALAVIAWPAGGSAAQSQAAPVQCPEGRLSADKCANAPVAQALRKNTIDRTQRKLSPTGTPLEKNQKLNPDR